MKAIPVSQAAVLANIVKQPSENRFYILDFSSVVRNKETVISATCYDQDLGVIVAVSFEGTFVTLELATGLNGALIPLRVIATGSMGSICEQDLLLQISDPANQIAPVLGSPPEIDGGDASSSDTTFTIDGGGANG